MILLFQTNFLIVFLVILFSISWWKNLEFLVPSFNQVTLFYASTCCLLIVLLYFHFNKSSSSTEPIRSSNIPIILSFFKILKKEFQYLIVCIINLNFIWISVLKKSESWVRESCKAFFNDFFFNKMLKTLKGLGSQLNLALNNNSPLWSEFFLGRVLRPRSANL